MAEGSSATSATAIRNKRRAGGGSGNASRATTPTNSSDGVASRKRPRSETPSQPTTAVAAAVVAEGSNDEKENDSNTIGNAGLKKKKKPNSGGGGEAVSSSMTFEEEIAFASSEATLRLLKTSLHRLTDGIPMRELKMIVSEAKTCEAALEEELWILKEGLKVEQQKKQKLTKKETTSSKNPSNSDAVDKSPSNQLASTKSSPASNGDEKNTGTSAEAKDGSSTTTTSTPTPKETPSLETMLESEFTPPDNNWTLSALLGRLRHELTTPLPPRSQLPDHREKQALTQMAQNVGMASQSTYKKRGPKQLPQVTTAATPTSSASANGTVNEPGGSAATTDANNADSGSAAAAAAVGNNGATTPTAAGISSATPTKTTNEASTTSTTSTVASLPAQSLLSEPSQFKRLESLPDFAEYRKEHATPDKLLAVWKKLTTHRSSLVFRRPVNPKEAPGYTERIRFPMDLSLIRKLVMSKHIKTYEGILKQVHLIGHNCVKYNGRESDYALVTREFESVATEYIWNAVMRETYGVGRGRWSRNASPMPPSTTSSARASPLASASAAAAPSAASGAASITPIAAAAAAAAAAAESAPSRPTSGPVPVTGSGATTSATKS